MTRAIERRYRRATMHGYRLAVLWLAVTACGDASQPAPPPAWSHRPGAPARPIAGNLYAGAEPLAGRVSLRLDAPDPSAWPGRDVDTTADGRFDFGLLPAGRYTIVAAAAGRISRVVDVDTRDDACAGLAIYAYPCPVDTWTVLHQGAPVPDAVVEVGGVAVAVSDASGQVAVCQRHVRRAVLRAPRHGAVALWDHGAHHRRIVDLPAAAAVSGAVVGDDGAPVVGAAVQPIVAIEQHLNDDSRVPAGLALGVTDAHGRFTVPALASTQPGRSARRPPARGEVELPPEPVPAAYHFVVWTSTARWEPAGIARPGDPPQRLILDNEHRVAPPSSSPAIAARISGHVRLAGAPFVDAEVAAPGAQHERDGGNATRTGRDGSFDLALTDDMFRRADPSGAIALHLVVDHDGDPVIARRLIPIQRGRDLTGVVIDIAGAGSIEGVLLQHDGTPSSPRGVAFTARGTGATYHLGTREGGHFRARLEHGQTYDVVAGHAPSAQAVVSLTAAAPDATVRLVLPPPPMAATPPASTSSPTTP
jgi:hypothetical protein